MGKKRCAGILQSKTLFLESIKTKLQVDAMFVTPKVGVFLYFGPLGVGLHLQQRSTTTY